MNKPSKRITVFCASSEKSPDVFKQAAVALGRCLAQRGWGLVFGGTGSGCMRVLADAFKEAGGYLTGIIPESMLQKGRAHPRCDEVVALENLSQRKKKLVELCDAMIALPGGPGTFDEIFDVLASKLCGEHRKPVYLLNVEDYFNPLLNVFEKMKENHFCSEDPLKLVTVIHDLDEIAAPLDHLAAAVERE